jgi:hypothetical protein
MPAEKSISELAALIHSNAQVLEAGAKDQPSGDFSLAFAMPPPPALRLDASLEGARQEIIEAMDELRARLLGPFLYMGSLALPIVRNLPS